VKQNGVRLTAKKRSKPGTRGKKSARTGHWSRSARERKKDRGNGFLGGEKDLPTNVGGRGSQRSDMDLMFTKGDKETGRGAISQP